MTKVQINDLTLKAVAVDTDEFELQQTGGGASRKTTRAGLLPTAAETKAAYESNADTNAFTDAEEAKLAGIATGATQNSPDATLLNRANHTGAQAISTVTGLQTALDTKATTADLTSHTGNVSNPHTVTKAQVGLSNVDNTSDLDKPVSTATQTALNAKQATLVSATNIKTINGASILGAGDLTVSGGGGGAVDSVNGQTGVVVLDADDIDDAATINKFVDAALISKVAGIEAGADVTDATNVNSAGAVMNSDTSTASMSFVIDEDTLASDSATKVPTQQSVKAYVDANAGGAVDSVNGATGVVVLDQDDVLDGTTYKQYSQTEKTKLAGIATGATANDTDANLLNRANHTGAQAQSTVTGLVTDLAGKQATLVSATNIKTINGASILGSGDLVVSGGGGGSGDVVGPTGATDNAVARYDSATGKLLQDSTVTISDGGGVAISTSTAINSLEVTHTAATGYGLYVNGSQTTDSAVYIRADSLTNGYALSVYSNSASGSGGSIVRIHQDHASSNKKALEIVQDGPNMGIDIDQNGNSQAIRVLSTSTSASIVEITAQASLAGGAKAFRIQSTQSNNGSGALGAFEMLNVSTTAEALFLRQMGTGEGVVIDMDGNGRSISIDSEATTAEMISVDTISAYSGGGIYIGDDPNLNYSSIGRGRSNTLGTNVFYRNYSSAVTEAPVLLVHQDNVADDQTALAIQGDGTGNGILIDQNGNGTALNIDSESTTADTVRVDASGTTTGRGLVVFTASSNFTNTSEGLLSVKADGASGTGHAAYIKQSGTGNGLFIDQNGNGQALRIDNAGTQDSIVVSQTGVLASGQYSLWLTSSVNQSTTSALARIEAANASTSASCLILSHIGTGSHLNFVGDPSNVSPKDGDFWFDGTNLKIRIGATTYNVDKTAA